MTSKCKCHLFILPTIVFLFIVWSYLVYILGCVFVVHTTLEICLYLPFFHILIVMLLWTFLSTVFTPMAAVPLNYKLTDEEIEALNSSADTQKNMILERICLKKHLVLQTRLSGGYIRYCFKCKHIKPDRAHHCSVCGVCVLKMDHHCPWINNCVGFSNQKNFILLHFYTTIYCLYILCTAAKYIIHAKEEHTSLFVVGIIIVVFYGLFGVTLLIAHFLMACKNETSIEKLQNLPMAVENSTYNLGCRKNIIEVFGNNWRLWLVPVFTTLGTGCTFPLRIMNTNSSDV